MKLFSVMSACMSSSPQGLSGEKGDTGQKGEPGRMGLPGKMVSLSQQTSLTGILGILYVLLTCAHLSLCV